MSVARCARSSSSSKLPARWWGTSPEGASGADCSSSSVPEVIIIVVDASQQLNALSIFVTFRKLNNLLACLLWEERHGCFIHITSQPSSSINASAITRLYIFQQSNARKKPIILLNQLSVGTIGTMLSHLVLLPHSKACYQGHRIPRFTQSSHLHDTALSKRPGARAGIDQISLSHYCRRNCPYR